MAVKKYYSITELTREFGVSTRTLRFYEDEGLLHPERRGRTRLYRAADRRFLQEILRGRRIGFTIAEIDSAYKDVAIRRALLLKERTITERLIADIDRQRTPATEKKQPPRSLRPTSVVLTLPRHALRLFHRVRQGRRLRQWRKVARISTRGGLVSLTRDHQRRGITHHGAMRVLGQHATLGESFDDGAR